MIAIAGGLLALLGIVSAALLAAAALGLVATGAGLSPPNGVTGTKPLRYVAIVGGFLGALGTAAYGRRAGPAQTS